MGRSPGIGAAGCAGSVRSPGGRIVRPLPGDDRDGHSGPALLLCGRRGCGGKHTPVCLLAVGGERAADHGAHFSALFRGLSPLCRPAGLWPSEFLLGGVSGHRVSLTGCCRDLADVGELGKNHPDHGSGRGTIFHRMLQQDTRELAGLLEECEEFCADQGASMQQTFFVTMAVEEMSQAIFTHAQDSGRSGIYIQITLFQSEPGVLISTSGTTPWRLTRFPCGPPRSRRRTARSWLWTVWGCSW